MPRVIADTKWCVFQTITPYLPLRKTGGIYRKIKPPSPISSQSSSWVSIPRMENDLIWRALCAQMCTRVQKRPPEMMVHNGNTSHTHTIMKRCRSYAQRKRAVMLFMEIHKVSKPAPPSSHKHTPLFITQWPFCPRPSGDWLVVSWVIDYLGNRREREAGGIMREEESYVQRVMLMQSHVPLSVLLVMSRSALWVTTSDHVACSETLLLWPIGL